MKTYTFPRYAYRPPPELRGGGRHRPVVVVGAGPVGLAAAIDLALHGVACVVIDDDDTVSIGSRAICWSKRSLEILERLGVAGRMMAKGVTWQSGRIFLGERELYRFDLADEGRQRFPAFINLQQYYVEQYLVERAQEFPEIELRWRNRLAGIAARADGVALDVDTPDGRYRLDADWVIAADGARSETRRLMGLDFLGRVFEDRFLIADVVMRAGFPKERWFWFDPPFNPRQSALLHMQADDVWRIDLQLGWDADPDEERKPERVVPRIKRMLGVDTAFDLEWTSVYTFQCRRLERFRHGRVMFAGDAAHQVSPFGARGANSGLQDVDNLAWKLALVIAGKAPEALLDSYDAERVPAADENILNSTRATDFITPKTAASRAFRDATLELAAAWPFARALVNSGRLSRPATYADSPLDAPASCAPARQRVGAPAADAPVRVVEDSGARACLREADLPSPAEAGFAKAGAASLRRRQDGWLLDELGGGFAALTLAGGRVPQGLSDLARDAVPVRALVVEPEPIPGATTVIDSAGQLTRLFGDRPGATFLFRPDQHLCACWPAFDARAVRAARDRALALGQPVAAATAEGS